MRSWGFSNRLQSTSISYLPQGPPLFLWRLHDTTYTRHVMTALDLCEEFKREDLVIKLCGRLTQLKRLRTSAFWLIELHPLPLQHRIGVQIYERQVCAYAMWKHHVYKLGCSLFQEQKHMKAYWYPLLKMGSSWWWLLLGGGASHHIYIYIWFVNVCMIAMHIDATEK